MQSNNSFKINTILLQKFNFEQVGKLENIKGDTLNLKQGIGTGLKKDKNTYIVLLQLDLKMLQEQNTIYIIESAIMAQIEVSEGFEEKLLNDVVAILYSYLRPMIAQVTVMAKLPPLDLPPPDLPPINLSDIKISPIEEKSSK